MIDISKAIQKLANIMQPKPVLLWENPNPESSFAAQDIHIDNIYSYEHIAIIFNGRSCGSLTTYADNPYSNFLYATFTSISSNVAYVNTRVIKKIDAGFEVGDNIEQAARAGSTQLVQNDRNVPYKIYGIKY